jgi:hypothetical protein
MCLPILYLEKAASFSHLITVYFYRLLDSMMRKVRKQSSVSELGALLEGIFCRSPGKET